MRAGFYPKLAFEGMRKNKRMFLPYILTCIGMVMMNYIILFLANDPIVSATRGGETVQEMLRLGGRLIEIFACIFLFYTNSFLIRRRKKEFGLYHILGMGKRNIGVILFWETLFTALLSVGAGSVAGMALSKLAELGLVRIIQGDITDTLSVSPNALIETAIAFAVIFVLLFLNSLRQVRFQSAISLLRSENVGEKPPKGNWFLGLAGLGMLIAAYTISVRIKDPVAALTAFFFAVILVIIGTYLLMIAGSVVFCRILQKKKSYYYRSNHFVSVSSMVYRMKRNGAGLASICVLATMVLVIVSSTTSLYFGSEDAIKSRYPRDLNMGFYMSELDGLSDENIADLKNEIASILDDKQITPENDYAYRAVSVAGQMQGDTVEMDVTKVNPLEAFSNLWQFYFVPLSDYNNMMNANETLAEGEAIIYTYRSNYPEKTISFNHGNTFQIKKQVDSFVGISDAAMSITSSMVIIVPDLAKSMQGLDQLADYNGDRMISLQWIYNFDTGKEPEQQLDLYTALWSAFNASSGNRVQYGIWSLIFESQEQERSNFYLLFGGLFFLGILLCVVFVLAAVLIIYYKQISEGYEDQARFDIMQKVGMTKRDIRKSINSQLLTVFFLPLILASCHLSFAFPIIRKLLLLFNLNNAMLFAITTAISVLVFAVFYALVYKITSNAYYRLVSGLEEK